ERREGLRDGLEAEEPDVGLEAGHEEGEKADVRSHVEDAGPGLDGNSVPQVRAMNEDLLEDELRLVAVEMEHRHAVGQLVEGAAGEALLLQAQHPARRDGL